MHFCTVQVYSLFRRTSLCELPVSCRMLSRGKASEQQTTPRNQTVSLNFQLHSMQRIFHVLSELKHRLRVPRKAVPPPKRRRTMNTSFPNTERLSDQMWSSFSNQETSYMYIYVVTFWYLQIFTLKCAQSREKSYLNFNFIFRPNHGRGRCETGRRR